MKTFKFRESYLIQGAKVMIAAAVIGMVAFAAKMSQVHAQEPVECGTVWSGSPSGEPSVTMECDDEGRLTRRVTPVKYQQTMQNPCEGSTYDPRDCTYTWGDPEVVIRNNGTTDPDDDYEVYIFKKIDSCRPDVTGTKEVPIRFCCGQ